MGLQMPWQVHPLKVGSLSPRTGYMHVKALGKSTPTSWSTFLSRGLPDGLTEDQYWPGLIADLELAGLSDRATPDFTPKIHCLWAVQVAVGDGH